MKLRGRGPHGTMDSILASHPAATGLILGVSEFFSEENLMWPGFINGPLLRESAKLNS